MRSTLLCMERSRLDHTHAPSSHDQRGSRPKTPHTHKMLGACCALHSNHTETLNEPITSPIPLDAPRLPRFRTRVPRLSRLRTRVPRPLRLHCSSNAARGTFLHVLHILDGSDRPTQPQMQMARIQRRWEFFLDAFL